jgi:hypothetical protein
MIENYSGVVAFIDRRTGILLSKDHARKLARRSHDPLPVRRFLGQIVADEKDLDAWIERQWSPPRLPQPAPSPKAR